MTYILYKVCVAVEHLHNMEELSNQLSSRFVVWLGFLKFFKKVTTYNYKLPVSWKMNEHIINELKKKYPSLEIVFYLEVYHVMQTKKRVTFL